jgi:hypothetical protein
VTPLDMAMGKGGGRGGNDTNPHKATAALIRTLLSAEAAK